MITNKQHAIAVVTGASAGLGQALAVEFTRRGIPVAGLGRDLAGLSETAELISGATFLPMTVDVSDNDAVANAFERVKRELGVPTILFNNAAIHPRRDFVHEGPEAFMYCVAINLGGAVNCTHAALQGMVNSGVGRIINVGSFADLAPQPTCGAYSVSKGAIRIFTRALVADLGDRFPDIVVSTWMPGILRTRMGLADGLDPALAAYWGVELSLTADRSLNGVEFERDRQMALPQSLKRRIFSKLLRRKTPLMQLSTRQPLSLQT
jgi:NAD(P)-dependent dehydrogenase (short-subunit alcohol dehydrogenase family)